MPQVDAFFFCLITIHRIFITQSDIHASNLLLYNLRKIVIEILFDALQHPSTNPTSTPALFAFFLLKKEKSDAKYHLPIYNW